MKVEDSVLQGGYVRLQPLEFRHVEELGAASAVDPSLYQWSPTPQGEGVGFCKGTAAKYHGLREGNRIF
jgi:hypothetical protein